MIQIQDHQKDQLKELHFVFQSLTQLVKLFNSFCCTIVLGKIQLFIVFFSQLLHIQTGGDLQGCQFLDCFVHVFLQIKYLFLLLFMRQFCIIIILQCIIQLFFLNFAFRPLMPCFGQKFSLLRYLLFFSDIISSSFFF